MKHVIGLVPLIQRLKPRLTSFEALGIEVRLLAHCRTWITTCWSLILVIAIGGPHQSAPAQNVQVQLTNEQTLILEGLSLTSTGVSGKTPPGLNQEFQFSELARIQWTREISRANAIECVVSLVDQSELVGSGLLSTGAGVELTLAAIGAQVQLDSRMVQSIRMGKLAQRDASLADWKELNKTAPTATDGLAIYRDGRLQWLEGKIGEVALEHIQFTIEERTANVKRSRVEGLRFARPTVQNQLKPLASMELQGGTNLRVARWQPKGNRLAVTLMCGLEVEFGMEQIVQIDFASSRSKWLSDFEPATLDWRPLLGGAAALERMRQLNLPRINNTSRGEPLQLEFSNNPGVEFSFSTRNFEHGFAIAAGGKMAFLLNGEYSKLTGLAGFDPNAAPAGNVTLILRGDQRELLRLELTNASRANPRSIDVDISQVDRLVIEVDYADGRSSGDLLNLCDWRVHQ